MIMTRNSNEITEVVRVLKKCRNIFFITGAGVSADSGLPTYRGIAGLYNDKPTEDGISVEMALAGETLKKSPEITWKYLAKIEEKCRNATFNRAHEVIADMERHFDKVIVLTQNIDGFHKAAGSSDIIDIHGDLHEILCENCGWHRTIKNFSEINIPPLCPECRCMARPNVVFFGEMLPFDKSRRLYEELYNDFDIYFSVGTTSLFPYIQEPMRAARSLGKTTVEINPADTEISLRVDIKISMGAADALDAIWSEFCA